MAEQEKKQDEKEAKKPEQEPKKDEKKEEKKEEKEPRREEKETAREKLLKMSEVSLWLDGYDDIFSDFDPRPYPQRTLSDDFLNEAKKASREKISGIELKLLVPKNIRDTEKESLVKRRLHEHFKKRTQEIKKQIMHIKMQGIIFLFTGILLMFIAAFISFRYTEHNLFSSFLIILLEPAGWFLFWEGSHFLLFEADTVKPDFEFYKKMGKCQIEFVEY